MTRYTLAVALVLLGACAKTPLPTPQPSVPAQTLAYGPSAGANATYAFRDSTFAAIQGGVVGNIEISTAASATAEVAFAPKGPNVEATIRVTDFEGASTNSATGTKSTATESEIGGSAVLIVTAGGDATITSLPTLSPVIQRAGMNPNFFRWFFIPLPAAPVKPGAVWTDTLRTTDDAAGTTVSIDVVVTSTFVRDTVVNGRTLALISTSSQRSVNISGNSEGVQISQKLSGPGSGSAMWDVERRLLVQRSESWQLNGTFDLPQMGISGLPIAARSGVNLRLQ